MPTAPAPEKEPPVQYPSCSGCPTPEEATRIEGSCPGPNRVELVDAKTNLVDCGKVVCEELVYCPKTQKSVTK